MILKNAKIVLENSVIDKGWIKIKNRKITEINIGDCNVANAIDLDNKYLIPGFIDVHVHGGYGNSFESQDIDQYYDFAKNLPKEGVTSYLFATVAMSDSDLKKALPIFKQFVTNQKQSSAHCLGLAMEGPYISELKRGAHEVKLLRKPSIEEMRDYIDLSGKNIRMVIYAPELQDGSFTKFLLKNNIIPSAGHTNLFSKEFDKHYNDSIHHICHLYNAMNGVDHRNPGLVVGCLKQDKILCELITDGIHISDDVIKMTYKALGRNNLCIITDATCAKGLNDGYYKLGNLDVIKRGYSINLVENNILAGSVATFDHNFRYAHKTLSKWASLNDLIHLSSINVSKELKIDHLTGSIAIGKQADIVVLDQNLQVESTFIGGEKVYGK